MEQHMQALAKANEVRTNVSLVKRKLMEGRITVADAINEPCMTNVWVVDVLMAQHRWGRSRALRLLAACHMSENKACGAMTTRQRLELTEEIERRNGL